MLAFTLLFYACFHCSHHAALVMALFFLIVVQSRSQVASEAESILSELGHSLTHVVKEPMENVHQVQLKASELHKYSQQMLSRLSR